MQDDMTNRLPEIYTKLDYLVLVLTFHTQRQGGLIVETLTIVVIEDEDSHFNLMKCAIIKKFPCASVTL